MGGLNRHFTLAMTHTRYQPRIKHTVLCGYKNPNYKPKMVKMNRKIESSMFSVKFHSDGDTSSWLSMVRILREQSTNNVAVYVAHYYALGRPLSRRKKTECLASVIGGAVTALTVAQGKWYMLLCYKHTESNKLTETETDVLETHFLNLLTFRRKRENLCIFILTLLSYSFFLSV